MPGSFYAYQDRTGVTCYRLIGTHGLVVASGELYPISHRLRRRGPNPVHQMVVVLFLLVAALVAAVGTPSHAHAAPVPAAMVRCAQ